MMLAALHKIPLQKTLWTQSVYVQLGYVLLFNTAIAVLLVLLITGASFWDTLLISQCIGVTIFLCFYLFGHFFALRGWRVAIPMAVGAVLGVAIGIVVMGLIKGRLQQISADLLLSNIDKLLVNLFLAIFFGVIIMYFFISRERQLQANNALQAAEINNLDQQKQIAETRLQLLQAQIEPHFLFNSLSNVISLIEGDPPRAKLMLESLTRYLRSTLSRSQERDGTLRDELGLIENYLKIIQIRMGKHLSYQINVTDDLLDHPFPIMLIQPLVENAIQHGLDPLPKGGEVLIEVNSNDQVLQVRVIDNGAGFQGETLSGFGLYNVRQRLRSLFGETGRLILEDNTPQGVCVKIEIPYV